MKFIDLFAGIGGFRLGLERCNSNQRTNEESESSKLDEDVRLRKRETIQEVSWSGRRNGDLDKKERSVLSTDGGRIRTVHSSRDRRNTEKRWKNKGKKPSIKKHTRNRKHAFSCAYSNEWDKYASQIYKKHFGECDTSDITTVRTDEIPDHDLLCAGFPCQSFSIAGKRLGFDDTRGTLFFEIARILADKRPRYLLLENVRGLLSHDKGQTFKTIIGVLTDLGYSLEWQVLNSKDFGVPQNRERIFIIGHLGEECRPQVFPIQESNETHLEEITQEVSDAQRIYDSKGIAKTLKGLGGGLGAKTGLYKTGTRIRRLTPTECERLQGFPDGWTLGLSDTQRYKTLGNAVTVNVVEAIGQRLNGTTRNTETSSEK
jgi:site-specific DNA-cytosine methylase